MRNHEKAFGQMKSYYNDITNDNLKLIKSLKDEVAEMKKKAVEPEADARHPQENQRLKEPLTIAVAEVADLRAQLKALEDRLSLRNAKARLQLSRTRDAAWEHAGTATEYANVEKEQTLQPVRGPSSRSRRPTSATSCLTRSSATWSRPENAMQVTQIVGAATLDPIEMEKVDARSTRPRAISSSRTSDRLVRHEELQ